MANTLTVIGSMNGDHVIHVPHLVKAGETLQGYDYQLAYGGKGANQAVAATKLGAKTQFIACMGQDSLGQAMKASFEQLGMDVHAVNAMDQQSTGLAMIQVSDQGENSIVISAGANACLDEAYIERYASLIAHAQAILLQLETPLSAVEKAVQLAHENGVQVVLNPAPAKPLPKTLLERLTMLTPNETEAEILTGIAVVDEQTAQQAAHVLHQQGVPIVMITMGEKGVFYSTPQQQGLVPSFKVKVVDTTAAGDTFNAGLLVALLEEKSLEQAIVFGQAAAALSVSKAGAQPSIPTREQVDAFLVQQA